MEESVFKQAGRRQSIRPTRGRPDENSAHQSLGGLLGLAMLSEDGHTPMLRGRCIPEDSGTSQILLCVSSSGSS